MSLADSDTARGSPVLRHHIRCATLTGYPQLARSLGLDPENLMGSVGLDVADLAVPDRWIPAAPAVRLLDLSAQRSGREDFALLMSGFRRFSTLGPISVVIAQEPDLGGALRILCEYEQAYVGAMQMQLSETGDRAVVEVWLDLGEPVPARQGLELAAGALVGVVRDLVRGDWQPSYASFSHPAPADRSTHHRVFGPDLRFEQEFTGLVFPAAELAVPIVTSDPSLRPFARRFLHQVAPPHGHALVEEVRELVCLLLPMGRCSVGQISQTMALTPRTLHRQLAEQGQSFSSILNQTRRGLAERHLANERYSLTEVSLLLGFTAPSAFSRWFRQQFGTTATRWRESMHSAAAG